MESHSPAIGETAPAAAIIYVLPAVPVDKPAQRPCFSRLVFPLTPFSFFLRIYIYSICLDKVPSRISPSTFPVPAAHWVQNMTPSNNNDLGREFLCGQEQDVIRGEACRVVDRPGLLLAWYSSSRAEHTGPAPPPGTRQQLLHSLPLSARLPGSWRLELGRLGASTTRMSKWCMLAECRLGTSGHGSQWSQQPSARVSTESSSSLSRTSSCSTAGNGAPAESSKKTWRGCTVQPGEHSWRRLQFKFSVAACLPSLGEREMLGNPISGEVSKEPK